MCLLIYKTMKDSMKKYFSLIFSLSAGFMLVGQLVAMEEMKQQLLEAAATGDLETVSALTKRKFKFGILPHRKVDDEETLENAIGDAEKNGHTDIVNFLFDHSGLWSDRKNTNKLILIACFGLTTIFKRPEYINEYYLGAAKSYRNLPEGVHVPVTTIVKLADWQNQGIKMAIEYGHFELASAMVDKFFPLARATGYLETDKKSLQKLKVAAETKD